MPAKSRFVRLDAFTKTVEDARVRTTSGGVVTIASLIVIFYLILGEWWDYRRVVVQPELIVDKGRGERMEIHLNISFPRIPCELLTLDVMDVSGEQQTGVSHGVSKVRLSPSGEVIDMKALDLHAAEEAASHLDPDYCGGCYGAPSPKNAIKENCCNTCEEVREAYAANSWAFGRGENVEQCEREGYAERLDEQRQEGCRIEGDLHVNKVIGNFHIAPGRSFSNGNLHLHDLANYYETPIQGGHVFTHEIHSLRFGPKLPDSLADQWGDHHHTNPLDGVVQTTVETAHNYMYFIKVVSTSYYPLNYDPSTSSPSSSAIESHQYSVTSHERALAGGSDASTGHKERLHAHGGIPGVFFSYDISPMKVVNREVRPKSFMAFLTGVAAVIGGTLTVAAAVDRGVYEGGKRVGNKLHST